MAVSQHMQAYENGDTYTLPCYNSHTRTDDVISMNVLVKLGHPWVAWGLCTRVTVATRIRTGIAQKALGFLLLYRAHCRSLGSLGLGRDRVVHLKLFIMFPELCQY